MVNQAVKQSLMKGDGPMLCKHRVLGPFQACSLNEDEENYLVLETKSRLPTASRRAPLFAILVSLVRRKDLLPGTEDYERKIRLNFKWLFLVPTSGGFSYFFVRDNK